MSGYLSTQVGLLRNWKTHYYVLEARRLCYYRNETVNFLFFSLWKKKLFGKKISWLETWTARCNQS